MKNIILILTLLICKSLSTQELTLSGTVKISLEKGTIDCDLTLSDIPTIKDYEILINTGMNIKYFRNSEFQSNIAYDKKYMENISYESFLYSFPNGNNDGKFIPKKIELNYSGKFPVFNDTIKAYKKGDWRGNIAFVNNILRMDGIQSNWYPVLYDIKKDKIYDKIKYNIKVTCNKCSSLYINGNEPIRANEYNFSSNQPVELFVLAGKYDFYNVNKTFYLNPDINQKEMEKFSGITQQFKDFYSKKLGIPYNRNINYIQTLPTTKKNAFSFIAFPSIVNVGREYGLKSFISEKNTFSRPFLAHELAHYYFGSGYRKFNSVIFGIIQEGFAEYMSYQASKEFLGMDIYQHKLKNALNNIEKSDINFISISKIETKDDFKNYYRYAYDYFPLILLAIEQEIGEKKMWKWAKNLLTTKANFTDYEFLKNTLTKTINNPEKSKEIIKRFFISDKSLENALKQVKNLR